MAFQFWNSTRELVVSVSYFMSQTLSSCWEHKGLNAWAIANPAGNGWLKSLFFLVRCRLKSILHSLHRRLFHLCWGTSSLHPSVPWQPSTLGDQCSVGPTQVGGSTTGSSYRPAVTSHVYTCSVNRKVTDSTVIHLILHSWFLTCFWIVFITTVIYTLQLSTDCMTISDPLIYVLVCMLNYNANHLNMMCIAATIKQCI